MYELIRLEGRRKVVHCGVTTGELADILIEWEEIKYSERQDTIKYISRIINPKHKAKTMLNKRYTVNLTEETLYKFSSTEEIYTTFKKLYLIECGIEDTGLFEEAQIKSYLKAHDVTDSWAEIVARKYSLSLDKIASHADGEVLTYKEATEYSSRKYLIGDRKLYSKKRVGDSVHYRIKKLFNKSNELYFSVDIKNIPEESNTFSLGFWNKEGMISFNPETRINGKSVKAFESFPLALIEVEKDYDIVTRGRVDELERRVAKLETGNERIKRELSEVKKERDELVELKDFLTFLKGSNLKLVKDGWEEYKNIKEM
jgi:hypothetical protein